MAVSIGVSVTGTKELQRALKKMDPGTNEKILRNSLLEMAYRLQKDVVKNQIRHAPQTSPPIAGKLTNRHGGAGLVGSIRVNRGPLPFAIEVGTDKAYGARHEFGRKMPKRPFLQPALDKIAPKFGDIVIKHWKKEAGL
jgi:hypothetical protein